MAVIRCDRTVPATRGLCLDQGYYVDNEVCEWIGTFNSKNKAFAYFLKY